MSERGQALRWLPLGLIRGLAGVAGAIYAWTHPKRVAVIERNLQFLDASLKRKTARRVYGEFGKTLADYFYIGTRSPADAVRIIGRTEGDEHLQKARQLGKGALVVTAHFGLFELGGLMLAHRGFPTLILTYPEPSRALSEWRAQFRRRWNVETLEIGPDRFAFLQIAERLRQGYFVASLIDRPHPSDHIPVSLPNGTVHFSTGILLLAAQGGIPVIPALMARQADGTYHSHIFPPLLIQDRGSRAETLRFYSQQIADTLLPILCTHSEQWYQFVPLSIS